MNAREYAERLTATANDYHAGRLTFAEFDARQSETWREIEAAGLGAPVTFQLRHVAEGAR